jgi:hypothetical protein
MSASVWSEICVGLVRDIGYKPRGYWAAEMLLYLPILNTPTVSGITPRPLFGCANMRTKR